MLSDGTLLSADCVLAATGARAACRLRSSRLLLDENGYIAVDGCHRSLSHPSVFAVGDVCARQDLAVARSGVHAVHAGPVLAGNLPAALKGGPLATYQPRRRSLYLLACGPQYAIASWGGFSAEGKWVWRWKKKIVRAFIDRFSAQGPPHDIVQDHYGRQLQHSDDLKTSACCDIGQMLTWLKPLLARIHPGVLSRYYGCGLVCPPLLEGCRVLDLGCGSGRDVYPLAQLVGPAGDVVGVNLTDEQLAVAEKHRVYHADAFGFANVRFLHGYIERLDDLDLEAGSFDVIVSNCVVNLSPDKDAVLRGVRRLLKDGGEFYFSDVYADRRVPDAVCNDHVLYGECLGGALPFDNISDAANNACCQAEQGEP